VDRSWDHDRSSSAAWPRGLPSGAVGAANAVKARRPGRARAAAVLAALSATLLLAAVVVVLVQALAGGGAGGGAGTGDRWSPTAGSALTCGLAALEVLGAVFVLRGTGRTVLVAASWITAGVVAVSAAAFLAEPPAGGPDAVAVALGLLAAVALTGMQVRLAHDRSVAAWISAASAEHALPRGSADLFDEGSGPRRPAAARVVVALLAPIAVLALATSAALTAGPGAEAAAGIPVPGPADGPTTTDVDGSTTGGPGAPVPPPASGTPGWSAEFAPDARTCGAGSMAACDDLYWKSGVDDVYDHYGSTCGGRLPRETAGGCVAALGATLN
jgi:hypothetical protein